MTRAEKRAFLASLRDRPSAFNRGMLGRGDYWAKQKEIARSVVRYHSTLVPTGNMVGKTFLAAGLLHWFLLTRPGCIVLATAPSQTQLEEVLWKNVEQCYRGARIPLGGRLLRSPLKVDLGNGWHALGYSTTTVERLSGHHAADLLTIIDEASGVDDAIYEALRSCGPSRELLIGNPLRPSGTFYERCTAAPDNPLANLIQIDSREGPHIGLERSTWGLADKTWLESIRHDYGEGSVWWTCHVEGRFPNDATDQVFKRDWIEKAIANPHVPGGVRRTSIDLGLGNGGDQSVVMTRDDNGVLACEASNRWGLEATASRAALQVQRFGVEHANVSWDAEGIGADFNNRLEAAGIKGARAYRGGSLGNSKFTNLRTASAWAARHRLDPDRMKRLPSGALIPQVPFSLARVPGQSLVLLKKELMELRYHLLNENKTALEKAEDYARRLKRSPDHASAFTQSFGFDRSAA